MDDAYEHDDSDDDLDGRSGPAGSTRPGDDHRIVESLPGLARIAASAGWRTLQWMATETVQTGEEIVTAVAEGESPVPVIRDATHEAWSTVAKGFGRSDHEDEASPSTRKTPPSTRRTPPSTRRTTPPTRRAEHRATADELRARGAELLHQSADVRFTEDAHPAFERILEELTPDEARILRFLAIEGPQPSVDVRTNRPFGVGSEMVADGLSMIGLQAGVRRIDRARAYLNNLHRLGLIWFSRESVEPSRYQVVEVQPEVTEAMHRAGRAPKTVRRSIVLTAFGEDFCRTCLPVVPAPHEPPPPPGA